MEFVLVGLGGICGSLSRYIIGVYLNKKKELFPFGTFAVNIIGAFLLGLILSKDMYSSYKVLIADGFLGAFTTFSTFMLESYEFFKGKKYLNMSIYMIFSIGLGVLGFTLGKYM